MPPEALTITEPASPRTPSPRFFRSSIPATGDGVRDALKGLSQELALAKVTQEGCGNAEIVLAELLNNVVEHAYLGCATGKIDLEFEVDRTWLKASVVDLGKPMPGSRMPQKKAANIDVDRQDLPEGGFGWFLIHELVESMSYIRDGNANVVRFSMRFG